LAVDTADRSRLDARAQAILLGREIAERDLADSGGAFSLDEVRTVLNGISRQGVERRVSQGTLLAVPGPSNRRRYPTLQFNPDGTVVTGLADVIAALPTKNPWAVLNFLANQDPALGGRRPIDMLRKGQIAPVVTAAKSLGSAGR
jgi:hypothetical protein